VARASGSTYDVRHDHAVGFYRYAHIPVTTLETGDVMARAMVRWLEGERSLEFLDQEFARLPAGEVHDASRALRPAAAHTGSSRQSGFLASAACAAGTAAAATPAAAKRRPKGKASQAGAATGNPSDVAASAMRRS
jgi:NADH:ubiquinone oxidoreductase subunit D